MAHRDAITQLQLAAGRRSDDGTRDIALGLLLFTMSAGLDLGRLPVAMSFFIPLIVTAIQFHLVWPRAGYALEPRRFVAEAALLFGLSFLALLAVGGTVGVSGLTGIASGSAAADRVRLVTVAAILALPGLLGWLAHRRALPRYYGYAVAILAAFGLGSRFGLEARAWTLALFSVAVVGIGVVRLRRFLAANPPGAEDELAT
jgi:hypothetical protein